MGTETVRDREGADWTHRVDAGVGGGGRQYDGIDDRTA